MKRFLSFLLIGAALLSFAGCKNDGGEFVPPEWMEDPEVIDFVDFQDEIPAMTEAEAETYLEGENLDVTAPEYRKAVYIVNEITVADVITEAFETKTQTEELNQVFSGLAFRFIEGDKFGSETVRKRLFKRGSYALNEEDGWYYFEFYDRTLAQAATNLKDDHSLEAYTEVLELLLEDPNVEVRPIYKDYTIEE